MMSTQNRSLHGMAALQMLTLPGTVQTDATAATVFVICGSRLWDLCVEAQID